jgi:nitroreductase
MQDAIKKALEWRYAVKIFDASKKVAAEDVAAVLEAGRMAPTAYGLQPFGIVHVTDAALRARLREEASFNQVQVTDASELFVIAIRTDVDEAFVDAYIERIAATRGMDVAALEGFRKTMVGDITTRSEDERAKWAGRQAYIALGMMLETAALLQIDACPMEGFVPATVNEILQLSEKNLAAVGYMALGYRGDDAYAQAKKVRMTTEELVTVK